MLLYENGIVVIIEAHYHLLTPMEKRIADYFISGDARDFSARVVAETLFVSEASLSRFAKKCGFKGYREFIYAFQSYHSAFISNNGIEHQTRTIFNCYQELLSKAYFLLDEEQIKRVAQLITSKRRIFVYGKGSSGVAGSEFKWRFTRLGLDVDCIIDSHEMQMSAVLHQPDSLVIGISISGQSREVLDMLQNAKRNGAAVVGLSAHRLKAWTEVCDELLSVAMKDQLNYGKLISPQFPILLVCDLLFAHTLLINQQEKEAKYDYTLEQLIKTIG